MIVLLLIFPLNATFLSAGDVEDVHFFVQVCKKIVLLVDRTISVGSGGGFK